MIYGHKTKPFAHQIETGRRAYKKSGFGFLMEMGTGKTKVAIDEMGVYFCENLIDAAVIFAPKGVYRNWIIELETHLGIKYEVMYWKQGGGNKTYQRQLEKFIEKGKRFRILLVNIEAMSQTNGVAHKYVKKFVEANRCYIGVDESTTIKNLTSSRTKNTIEIGRLGVFRRIMSGSPAPNSPLDLYSQFEFLGSGLLGTRSYFNFRARYAVMQQKVFGGRKMQVVVGYKNIGELTKMVQDNSYRVLKDECLDLPDKIYRISDVDLTEQQHDLYQKMKNDAFAEIGGSFSNSQSALTTLLRLQQILCGHIVDADGKMHFIQSNRVETLMQELEGVSGGCIIWSRFRPEIDLIANAIKREYGEESVAQYHGGNTNTRVEEAHRYVNDDKCRFMVSTQQSGGYGNTWLKGTNVFYVSNTFSLEHRLQSEDRPHRGGQTQKCTYTDLRAIGTIDEKLIKALRSKIDVATTILGDDPKEWLI